jgi:hypothetical protein
LVSFALLAIHGITTNRHAVVAAGIAADAAVKLASVNLDMRRAPGFGPSKLCTQLFSEIVNAEHWEQISSNLLRWADWSVGTIFSPVRVSCDYAPKNCFSRTTHEALPTSQMASNLQIGCPLHAR